MTDSPQIEHVRYHANAMPLQIRALAIRSIRVETATGSENQTRGWRFGASFTRCALDRWIVRARFSTEPPQGQEGFKAEIEAGAGFEIMLKPQEGQEDFPPRFIASMKLCMVQVLIGFIRAKLWDAYVDWAAGQSPQEPPVILPVFDAKGFLSEEDAALIREFSPRPSAAESEEAK